MFKRALICTDFSDSLQRLVDFVPDLAKSGLEQVVFFNSVPLMTSREIPCVDEEKVAEARQKLGVAKSSADIKVEVEVESGRAVDNILRIAKKYDSEVIFSGMPTRSVLNEKLFGSTTKGIAEQAERPILILRPQLMSAYRVGELSLRCQNLFNYLLIPYDGSQSAKNLVKMLQQQVKADPHHTLKTCLLCWVVEGGGRRGIPTADRVQQAEADLAQVKAELEKLDIEVKTEVRQGDPLEEILAAGEQHDISAIAVCSGKGGGLLKWTVPSFTSAILRASWHPVIHLLRC